MRPKFNHVTTELEIPRIPHLVLANNASRASRITRPISLPLGHLNPCQRFERHQYEFFSADPPSHSVARNHEGSFSVRHQRAAISQRAGCSGPLSVSSCMWGEGVVAVRANNIPSATFAVFTMCSRSSAAAKQSFIRGRVRDRIACARERDTTNRPNARTEFSLPL